MRDALHNVESHELIGEESESPLAVSLEWFTTTQGNQVGFLSPIEHMLARRLRLWRASQRGLEALLDKALSDVANGIDMTVESLDDVMVRLMGAIGIDLEQDVSVFNRDYQDLSKQLR